MKIITLALGLGLTLSTSAFATPITDPFTSFFSFGDSLTDDGKLGLLAPPSLGGRFSNGPTYAEIIADDFEANGHDTGNLALGGATAGDTNLSPIPGAPFNTFSSQIGVFADALGLAGPGDTPNPLITGLAPVPTFDTAPPDTGSNPLLSVFFGANDLFQAFEVAGSGVVDPADVPAFLVNAAFNAANAVETGIRALNGLDPSVFDDFLVIGLPDLGATPAFSGDATASAVTSVFNLQLTQNLLSLNNDGINVIGFDPNEALNAIIADANFNNGDIFGITNVSTPCTASFSAALLVPPSQVSQIPSCLDDGIDPNTVLFGDSVHPNAVAQALLASELRGQIEIAPVPLPASLPLLLFGIAGMGIVARRRRS
ncbi:SGNH/GDSL hydrolase family protein [Roseovarius phycicola]|uniref:SGNH/GDSL hydrolase family protein n=1 Tax=Roseovarius phycicola TaxID=3080976 RepID=A0ABZ2HII2_9RHOB